MAKHKAATQVSIASTMREDTFNLFVQKYWKAGAVVLVAISAAILMRSYMSQSSKQSEDASWDRLREQIEFGHGFSAPVATKAGFGAGTLGQLSGELDGELAGPWAKALEVRQYIEESDFAAAQKSLAELERGYGDHPLLTQEFVFEEGEAPTTLADHIRGRIEGLDAWKSRNSQLFGNPEVPADATRVKLVTSQGEIVVGLYEERAPKHCENFVKLCKEGFYDGTAFHRVMQDFMIQGGDPNSRDGEPETWGTGGPGYKIEPELADDLAHFEHVLAAAKQPGDTESSGSQFYITTGTPHHLDGVHTIFGALLEGASVVERIETAETTGERPNDPVIIQSTQVL